VKRVLQGSLLLLASIVAALAAAEIFVRATDFMGVSYFRDVGRYLTEAIEPAPPDEIGPHGRIFQNRPDVDLELRTFRYRTDAFGLRRGAEERDYAPEREEERPRILFLGDSVTLAWGVDEEESWVRTVGREGRTPDGRTPRVLNAGHLMYDTVQEASLLRAWGPLHRPDVVVLTFVLNDLQPTWDQVVEMTGGQPLGEQGASSMSWGPSFLSRLLPALHDLVRFWREKRLYERADPRELPPLSSYPTGWPRCAEALDELRRTCAELGARLVVFDNTTPPVPELVTWCLAREVPLVRTAFTPEEEARDVHNSPVDAHANARGNRILADKALAGLRALEILAPADE
jgi:hypothetical protein